MNPVEEKQKEIIAKFAGFSSWEERYKYIIQLGKNLPPFPADKRTDENRVKGCQSQVWLHAFLEGDRVIYQADSDAMIVKGLASILVSVFNNQQPSAIVQSGTDFLSEIGLTSHLSQSRANGLAAMVKQFKNYAVAFQVLLARQ